MTHGSQKPAQRQSKSVTESSPRETSTSSDFKTRVQQQYEKQKTEGWVSGELLDIQVESEFTVFGIVLDSSYENDADTKSIDKLDRDTKETVIPTQTSVPELLRGLNLTQLPIIYRKNISQDVIEVNSLDDFSQVTPQNDVSYYLLPADQLDLNGYEEGAYLLGEVSYNICSSLSAESLLDPVTLRTEDTFQDLDAITHTIFSADSDPVPIEFTVENGVVTQIQERKTTQVVAEKYIKIAISALLTAIVSFIMIRVFLTTYGIGILSTDRLASTIAISVIMSAISSVDLLENHEFIESHTVTETADKIAGSPLQNISTKTSTDLGLKTDSSVHSVVGYPTEENTLEIESPIEDEPSTLVWNLQAETGTGFSQAAVEIFVEYGFEKDFDTVDVKITKDEQLIPDNTPTITDTTGTWYLFVADN